MPQPKHFDQWFARWKKLTDGLFGTIEDITHDEAKDILTVSQVDSQSTRERLYERLSKHARSLRAKGQPVPDQILEALEAFRPETAPARNVEELERHAERQFDELLRQPFPTTVPAQLAFSYRNKSDLSPEDRQLLDKLAKKLEERIKHK